MPESRRARGPRWLFVLAAALVLIMAGCSLPTSGPLPIQPGQPTDPNLPGDPSDPTQPTPTSPASPEPTGPRVLLDESFSSGTLNESVWNTCHWWADEGCTIASNNELEWYRPEGVQVADGMLQLTAERGDQRGSDGRTYPFRSGMVTTGPPSSDDQAKLSFTYGTVEARLRVPKGKGLWSAMWLLPADTESRPEIDVLEILGNDPTTSIMHLHPRDRGADSPDKKVKLPGKDFSAGWHDFKLDWNPGQLDFFIDGKRVWRLTGAQVPDEPMYLIFNLAVGGVYPGDPDDSTPFPATFAVDRVKITAAD